MSVPVVVDTCVLSDALFRERPRHDQAKRLLEQLGRRGVPLLVPAHAFFELASVAFSEFHRRKAPLTMGELGKDLRVDLELVPIDGSFIQRYLVGSFSDGHKLDASAGDMIFLALALVDGLDFITEDHRLKTRGLSLGARVFSVDEYLGVSPSGVEA